MTAMKRRRTLFTILRVNYRIFVIRTFVRQVFDYYPHVIHCEEFSCELEISRPESIPRTFSQPKHGTKSDFNFAREQCHLPLLAFEMRKGTVF